MHCPAGNATDPIWRVLTSSQGISSWTPLKLQHSNHNPLANQIWCIDFLTPPKPLIIPYRLTAFHKSLMPLKNWCSIHARWSKSSLKHSIRFCSIFTSLKQNFIAYSSSKMSPRPDCIFEIHQLWQSGFSRVYSNCCCSCSFEVEIVKIGQSSHKMYSNTKVNFQESTTILNAPTKMSGNLLNAKSSSFFPIHILCRFGENWVLFEKIMDYFGSVKVTLYWTSRMWNAFYERSSTSLIFKSFLLIYQISK